MARCRQGRQAKTSFLVIDAQSVSNTDSAKLNNLDPTAWLNGTLEKLTAWPNSKIDELLPFGKCASWHKLNLFEQVSGSNTYTLSQHDNRRG